MTSIPSHMGQASLPGACMEGFLCRYWYGHRRRVVLQVVTNSAALWKARALASLELHFSSVFDEVMA